MIKICTAVKLKAEKAFFGRNLDVEFSFGEKLVFVPESFSMSFRNENEMSTHFSMVGTAAVFDKKPLFYDAVNEHGLYVAALSFCESAAYLPKKEGFINLAPFEVIPFVLGRCSNAHQAKNLLKKVNVTNDEFSPELPNTPLHWFVADREGSFAAEPLSTGLSVTENPAEVLTNEPPLDFHLENLRNFTNLSPREGPSKFSENLDLKPFSRGISAFGLPGDFSSASRFVKAVFVKENAVLSECESENATMLFHVLSSVAMPKGCLRLENGELEHTLCSTCATEDGKYYFKTAQNERPTLFDIKKEHPDSSVLKIFPMHRRADVLMLN